MIQALNDRRVIVERLMSERDGSPRCGITLHCYQIFDRVRNSVQRPAKLASFDLGLRLTRLAKRKLWCQRRESIQTRANRSATL